jgi:hypothetical protein
MVSDAQGGVLEGELSTGGLLQLFYCNDSGVHKEGGTLQVFLSAIMELCTLKMALSMILISFHSC